MARELQREPGLADTARTDKRDQAHRRRVADDREEPGAAVATGECAEISKRAEAGLLHDVLGIFLGRMSR